MNILVTGSEGFVASNLIPQLSNCNIIALDYINTQKPVNITEYNEFYNFDLSTGVPKVHESIDVIIHLATVNQLAIANDPKLVKINTTATQNILDLARAENAKLIFSSSCSVYGNGLNLREDYPLKPCSLYAIGKCYEEQLMNFYHKSYGCDITVLRFSNCYGDTTSLFNKIYPGKKDVSRIFMERIPFGVPIPLIRGMSRDYTYIDDVVDSIISTIPLPEFEIFNVATGIATLTDMLVDIISEIVNMTPNIVEQVPRSTDNVHDRSLNVEKISPYWVPTVGLKEGMKRYAKRMFD
jgi:nucleoside-diphosphate-sugar epimerase